MKDIIKLLLSCMGVLLIFVTACQKNLSKDLELDSWNHERSIMNIRFEHQIGDPIIVRDEHGSAEVLIYVNLQSMTSNDLELQQLNLSYGAKSDVQVGQKISFDQDYTTTIRITSQSGQTRDWLIQLQPFDDPILGTWRISKLQAYGGKAPAYNASGVVDIGTVSLMNRTEPHASSELDNILTFTLEGVEPDGTAYGTLKNDPGEDGKYAKFYITNSKNEILYDMNLVYRTIPEGTSTWRKNGTDGLVTIISPEGISHTCHFLEAQTVTLFKDSDPKNLREVDIDDHALQFSIKRPYVPAQLAPYNMMDYLYNPREYFIHIEKAK